MKNRFMRIPRIAAGLLTGAAVLSLVLLFVAFPFTDRFLVLWLAAGAMAATASIIAYLLFDTAAENGFLTASSVVTVLASFIVPLFFTIRFISPGSGTERLAIWSVFIETVVLMIALWGVAFAGGYLTGGTSDTATDQPERSIELGERTEEDEYVLPGGEL